LHLFGAVTNNKPATIKEYNSTLNATRPLSTLRVGFGGEQVSILEDPYNWGDGYSNYTRFMNSILNKHKLKSTFYPLGANFPAGPLEAPGNSIGCNFATTEQFSLTIVEVAVNFPANWLDTSVTPNRSYSNTPGLSTLHHIETTQPFSLLAWSLPYKNVPIGPIQGFSAVKGAQSATWLNSIAWPQYNGVGLPINP
jgi:hypothetical protein